MDFYKISFYLCLHVVVFYHVAASQVTTNTFKLTACSNSSFVSVSKSSMTSPMSNLRCSASCHDQCLGCVSYDGKKHFSHVNEVLCLLPDLKPKSKDSNKQMELYLQNDYAKVIKDSNREGKGILIVNGWLLLRDSTSDEKRWTIIQRRVSDDVIFFRGWEDYQNGFGNLSGSFWIGLEKIYYFCSTLCVLRFDFKHNGNDYWASYKVSFTGADDDYRIDIKSDSFEGNVDDQFSRHSGMSFSTKDKDNDICKDLENCAFERKGAWWFDCCGQVNFNGIWGSTVYDDGLNWESVTGSYDSVTFVEMKIRPL